MTDTAEITAVQIARLAGVGRAAVSNWRKRHDDFPPPVGGTSASPTFRLSEVEAWLKANDKLADLASEEVAWQQIRAAFSDRGLADGLVFAGELIISMERYRHSGVDARGADALLAEIDPEKVVDGMRAAVRELTPVVEPPPVVDGQHVPLLRGLAHLVAEHGSAKAFDRLLARMYEATRMPAVPDHVAGLMVGLLGERPEVIYDPACGAGTLLRVAADHFGKVWLCGDEANPQLLAIAALRSLIRENAGSTFRNSGLRDPAVAPVHADAVVCAPLYSERDWGADALSYDPRWRYGVPPRMEPELAWVQHALANLRTGGRAVLLLPPAVAARGSGRRIRAELLRSGALRAIVALPAGAAPPQTLGLHLWVLVSPRPSKTPERVLIADLGHRTGDDHTEGDRSRLEGALWGEWMQALTVGLTAAEFGVDLPCSSQLTARTFRVVDLLDDDVDLSPTRRLSTEASAMDGQAILQLGRAVAEQLTTVVRRLPALYVPSDVQPMPMITIGDMVKSGVVTVISSTITRLDEVAGNEAPTTRVWLAKDVAEGRGPSTQMPSGLIPDTAVRLNAGDVVVPTVGSRMTARVVMEADADAVLGPHLVLIRAPTTSMDPWFLAGFLNRNANTHRAGSLGSMQRFDIRRAQVPRIAVKQQRPYGLLFQRLAEFDTLLGEAARAGGDMMKAVTDGLVAGTIQPGPTTTDPSTTKKGHR